MNLSIFSFRKFSTVLIIFCILFLAEGTLRIGQFGFSGLSLSHYSPQSIVYSNLIRKSENENLGWRLKPDFQGFYKGATFKTNQYGFRDQTMSDHESRGKRLAVLGRSISMGSGVAESDGWTAQLGKLMQKSDPEIEVFNFSVAGYNISQVRENFMKNVSPFSPNVILIPIYLAEWGIPIEENPKKTIASSMREKAQVIRFTGHSFLYWSLRHLSNTLTRDYLATDWKVLAEKNLPTQNLQKFSKLLAALSGYLVKKLKVKVILVSMPRPGNHLRGYTQTIRKGLKSWVSRQPRIHLIEADLDIGNQFTLDQTIYYGDAHPNAHVHRLIAQSVWNGLRN